MLKRRAFYRSIKVVAVKINNDFACCFFFFFLNNIIDKSPKTLHLPTMKNIDKRQFKLLLKQLWNIKYIK